jgi:tetratricopeptide (TPR) repeat protein
MSSSSSVANRRVAENILDTARWFREASTYWAVKRAGWLMSIVIVACWPAIAAAQPAVIESYTGRRPDEATRLLAPLHDELARRGYTSGDSLGRRYEARVSRPAVTPAGLPSDFATKIERGHKAWITGNFDDAVDALVSAIETAHANAATIAQDQANRQSVQKALIALALSQQRKGDLAAAKDTFQELLRSFPDAQISRATYGPEAYELFESVRRELGKSGRGRLTVKVPNASAVVFVNERFEAVGSVSKGDLFPGPYRVFVQIAKQASRVHRVEVKPEQETVLVIDPAYESALRTSGPTTGFEFADAGTRDKYEARYAAQFGNEVGASAIAVVGIDSVRGRPSLVGSVVDLRSAKEIRRASLALDPTPTVDRIRALGSFLAGQTAARGIEVEIGGAPAAAEDGGDEEDEEAQDAGDATESLGSSRAWMLWTGVGGVVLGATVGGALAIKFTLDSRDAAAELDRVCAVSCTSEQALGLEQRQKTANRNALISGIAGGVVVASGVTFIVLSRLGGTSRAAAPIAIAPAPGGAYATYAFEF